MDNYGNDYGDDCDGLRAMLAAAEAAMLALAQPCAWVEDAVGFWGSACGKRWALETTTPTGDGYDFCPGCGHPLSWGDGAPWTQAELDAATAKAAELGRLIEMACLVDED